MQLKNYQAMHLLDQVNRPHHYVRDTSRCMSHNCQLALRVITNVPGM